MNISQIAEVWSITDSYQLFPLSGGVNNRVWRVETPNGQYVLRLAHDATRITSIHYEVALLSALGDRHLPFALPIPIKANNGASVIPVEQEIGPSALAILTPLLPGHSPDWNDLPYAGSAGSALATLDSALATLPELDLPTGAQPPSTFADLAYRHPLIPDPFAACAQLPIDHDEANAVRAYLTSVLETVPDLYRRLPQQVLHRDYDPTNILVDHGHVTAVLDFEFVGPDLRVLDLCVALSWWPLDQMGTGREWPIIDAVGSAYTASLPLSEEELLAIPAVLRLRDVTSLVYRIGRYLAGLETDAPMADRVQHSLWREAWLTANRDTLLHHALSWLPPKKE